MALFSSHQNPLRNPSRLAEYFSSYPIESLNHVLPQQAVPFNLHGGTLESFSGQTRKAEFYRSHESPAPFGNQDSSAAVQKMVPQREPDVSQDRLEDDLEMFTNTYQGLNENPNAMLLVEVNHAKIPKSSNNAPNKDVLFPSEFFPNYHASANSPIVPPSYIVSGGTISQVTRPNRIQSHRDTDQTHPSTSLLPKGVDKFHGPGHQQKPWANVESGVTGSSDLDPKLQGSENYLANTLNQKNPHTSRKKSSRSYGSHPRFPDKLHDQAEGNVLGNYEGLSDKHVQSDRTPQTKVPSIVDQPIRSSFLNQHESLTEILSYSPAVAFPLSYRNERVWFSERLEEIKAHLVKLTPAIKKLHKFWDESKKTITFPRMEKQTLLAIGSRLERSFMSFSLMLEITLEYLEVEISAKADEDGKVDLEIDSLYSWWEGCWKGFRFLPLGQRVVKSDFIKFSSTAAEPVEVLEYWYTAEHFDYLSPFCSAWLVTKWMEGSAHHWFEALKKKLHWAKLLRMRIKEETLTEMLVATLYEEDKLGYEKAYQNETTKRRKKMKQN
ncbi:hypothetical protein CROQUDRAFT_109410 [Cronartium quercuum f. sp. fusiforme G11]|uniref:Uncharacterized protein n=1 Tax=Cronartium quercuum f. sp. fusiforme G11 TaxID=708437 RepID=A0A9P6NBY2_9BASI|nr:hypothetical protein CROQUDRAFT_109410 [Cronartium quercuum f. sp. fusiforme G11]